MTKGSMKTRLAAGAIGMLAILAIAPPALASTVTVLNANTVRVFESGNEVNKVSVSYDAGTDLYTVVDSAANLASGACVAVDAHTATCPGAGIKTISVDTDDMADSIAMDLNTIPSAVVGNLDGGGGNDAVSGHGTLTGGSGNDGIVGSPLADNVRAGSGRDMIEAGDGPDDIFGGSSTDALSYPASRATPVNVTVGSGNFNDGGIEDQGSNGRRDTVRGDVEVAIGTLQADLIAGDSSSETLIGGVGNDVLDGNRGNDTLLGLEGDDILVGDEGSDLLRGWTGADRLFGGRGNDRVSGGPDGDFVVGNSGHDILKGKGGIDFLRAKDGTRDFRIKCGRGNNRAEGATRDKRLDPRAKSC